MLYTMLIGSFMFDIITLYCFMILVAIEYQKFLSMLPEYGMVVLNAILVTNYRSQCTVVNNT